MPPNKLEFELKFLTPTFIGGADPTQKAEFNLKALKGAMRYWWRQAQDWSDTQDLFQKESQIFGSTKNSATFSLHLTNETGLNYDSSGQAYQPPNNSGRSYLFYSCVGRGGGQPGRTKWISEQSRIKFRLAFRLNDPLLLKETLLSLWLTQTFGGLGTRSRRGAGSFQLSLISATVTNDLQAEIQTLLGLEAVNLQQSLRSNNLRPPFFTLISSASPICLALMQPDRFKRSSSYSQTEGLLDCLGGIMKNYRSVFGDGGSSFQRDAQALHRFAVTSDTVPYSGRNSLPKHAFGLPIIYNFRRPRPERGLENENIEATPAEHERRASPLFISVKRDPSGSQVYANLLILWNQFLPPGESISLVVKNRHDKTVIKTKDALFPPANCQPLIEYLRRVP